MSNPRKIVFSALTKTENGGYSNLVLNNLLDTKSLSVIDLNFASALFYGVLERKITLDYIIENQSGRKLKQISPIALTALRMGVYQLIFMDKVPDSAAINESVKLVKNSKQSFLSGFTNAVLRNCQRNRKNLLPNEADEKSLSVIYSCPLWIIKSLISDYGKEDAIEFLKSSLNPAKVTVKVNNIKISVDEIINKFESKNVGVENTEISNYIVLKNMHGIASDELYLNGFYHVQDLASAYCVKSLGAQSGERVLDVCAAPGGKTFSIAEGIENNGEVVSCDIHSHRVELIQKGAERLGLTTVHAIKNDATVFNENLGVFDKVLCDVPCSGLGVIGRKPDIKYKKEQDFKALPEIQLQILITSSKYLKSGGRMVYSTCTLRKEENEKVVERFLNENSEYKLVSEQTLFPHKNGTDGFFIAVFER